MFKWFVQIWSCRQWRVWLCLDQNSCLLLRIILLTNQTWDLAITTCLVRWKIPWKGSILPAIEGGHNAAVTSMFSQKPLKLLYHVRKFFWNLKIYIICRLFQSRTGISISCCNHFLIKYLLIFRYQNVLFEQPLYTRRSRRNFSMPLN